MRSNQELMAGILRKKADYLAQRQIRELSALSGGIGVLLCAILLLAPGVTGEIGAREASALGAFLLGPEAGGYVIVALLAFVLGIVITMSTQKRRQLKDTRFQHTADEKDNQEESIKEA